MRGYFGQALIVDLSTGTGRYEPLPDDVLERFIGGVGLGAYLLYRHCPPGADPLGADNPLILVSSPLTGTRLTTTSKFAIVTKSPLTGFIGDSLSSSHIALELKRLGADAVVIQGRAPAWSVLVIDDSDVRLEPADDLLGLTTSQTEAAVKGRLGRVRVACIGPAGENLVRYASIANDGGRQAGRTGPGAVMGSKRLKAIAVRGGRSVKIADESALNDYARVLSRASLGPATEKYRVLGTMGNVAAFNRLGVLPAHNFRQSTFDGAEAVSGESLHATHAVKDAHCANCTIGCEKVLAVLDDGGGKGGTTSARMEYESLYALGPLVGVADPDAVVRAAHACDELGMDTISAGASIAWAMECSERGVLGEPIAFGDGEAVLGLIEAIGARAGVGDLLSGGVRRAAEQVGGGSEAWAMHVKGLEMPGYDPRGLKTLALGLAVNARGACHNRSSAYEADFSAEVDRLRVDDRRGAIAARSEDYAAVLDSMIWCKFLRKAFGDFWGESAQAYEWVTGRAASPEGLRLAGERICTLKKLFNVREGWTRADDTLPPRILEEPLSSGVGAGVALPRAELDAMIASYYEARGWTPTGMVPADRIAAMGLSDIVAPEAAALRPR